MSSAFFGGSFFGGGFFGDDAARVVSGGGAWKKRGQLGEAKFLKYRDKDHPSEIKRRKREEEEAARVEEARARMEALNAPVPYVPSIKDVGPGLGGLSPRGVEVPREDWKGKAKDIAAAKAAEEAERKRVEKARAEEEEYALMSVLLHGRR